MTYTITRMIAMNDPKPQPAIVRVESLDDAVTIAREHTLSEPWRTHAQVSWIDENGYHRAWYIRSEPNGPINVEVA